MPSGGKRIKKQDPLISILMEKSETWGKSVGLYPKGKEPKKEKMTPISKEIDKIISGANFGCQEDAVRMICNRLLNLNGESSIPMSKKEPLSKYTVEQGIVLVTTSGQYKDSINLVINAIGECIGLNGKEVERRKFKFSKNDTRLATEVEIIHLVDMIKKKYPDKLKLISLFIEE